MNYLEQVDLNYTDKELLAYLETKDQEYQADAIRLAKEHAFQEKPTENEPINQYRETIYRNYNLLEGEAHSRVQAGVQLRFGKLDMDETKIANENLELKLDELKAKRKQVKQPKPIPYATVVKVMVAILVTGFIWLGEIEFISKSLGLIGGGFLSNKILAIGISTTLLVLSHWAKRWTDGLKHKLTRKLARVGILILLFGVFTALGVLRQKYFQNAEIQLPLWVFIALNVLFFLGLYLVAIYLLLPAIKNLQKAIKDIKSNQKSKQLDKEMKQVEEEIQQNTLKLNKQHRLRLAIISFGKATQELIKRKYELAMSNYKETNLKVRKTPINMDNSDIPELDTYYTDINI